MGRGWRRGCPVSEGRSSLCGSPGLSFSTPRLARSATAEDEWLSCAPLDSEQVAHTSPARRRPGRFHARDRYLLRLLAWRQLVRFQVREFPRLSRAIATDSGLLAGPRRAAFRPRAAGGVIRRQQHHFEKGEFLALS